MNIFIHKNGQACGPYSLDEVNSRALAGEFHSSDSAWIEGWAEWQPLSRLSGFVLRPVPPPFKPQASPPPPIQPLPPQPPKIERSSKEAATSRATRRGSAATVGTYIAGLLLLIIGFFAQEGVDAYHVPRGIPAQTAAAIGGACPALLCLLGLFAWHRWFRGHRGSVMTLIGIIAAVKGLGALMAHLVMIFYMAQASPNVMPVTSAQPPPTSPAPLPTGQREDDQEFQRQRAKSKAETITLYPDVADHKTPIGKEVDRLIESYKITDDPILYAPDAPMLITLVAARNLGISARQEK